MGIQFAIHTYGYYDAMFHVVNGIKMIMASDFSMSLIKLMALIATGYYAVQAMATATQGGTGYYFIKTATMLLLVNGFIMPKADILVVDRVSGKKEIVRDLPLAFVLPVGMLEALGAGITSMFEQAFAPVGSASFKDYGMIFGSRMVQESKNWRIANPEFSRNMDSFINRCIVLEAMIGTRFTPDDVKSSPNLFRLVTENAGTFRKLDIRVNKSVTKMTCKEAGEELKKSFAQEFSFLNRKYRGTDYELAGSNGVAVPPAIGKLNGLLARNIELGYNSMLGVNSSAEEIVRQNMMINAIKDFNNMSDLYGYSRASAVQNSNWQLMGELGKEYLPLLLNIMKALVYASFIFVVPLMILSGGWSHYSKYCVLVFSLQIWPALNSILNLFIELYGNLRGSAVADGAITYGNFNQAHQVIDTISLVASGLQLSIPFLSFAIVRGGVDSFVHLAGQLQGASVSSAGVAGSEITSNSRSFDNVSMGNKNLEQNSGFKTDWNQSFQEGATQIQGTGGQMIRSFADGSSSINDGSNFNISSGSRRFTLGESVQGSMQMGLSNALTAMRSTEQSYRDAKSETISNVGDLVSHIAQRESAGETFNYDQAGEQGKALQQAVNHTKELHDHQGYSWSRSGNMTARAYAEGSIDKSFNLGIVSANAKVGVGGEVKSSLDHSHDQSANSDKKVIRSQDSNLSFNNLAKAAQNKQWMQDNSIDRSFAESTRSSFDKMKSYEQSAMQRREEADSYRDALEYSKNSSSSGERDMYHEVEQGVMKRYGVSQQDAHQMIEANDPRANKVWDDIVHENSSAILDRVGLGKAEINDYASQDDQNFKTEHESKVDGSSNEIVQEIADTRGLNHSQIATNVSKREEAISNEIQNIQDENIAQYHSGSEQNQNKEKEMQDQYTYRKRKLQNKSIPTKAVKEIGKLFENELPMSDIKNNSDKD